MSLTSNKRDMGQSEAQRAPIDIERLLAHHRLMVRIRAFETHAIRALERKLILGAIHPSVGQEAVAVGVVSQLAADDTLLSTHRGHGHTLVKGASPLAMMRELFGRQDGCCQGKGGSMHIADFSVGMLGANGVVGANIVIAAGAAHAIKMAGEKRVVCCIFGDGAINRGPFLEGLNWAGVYQLPILFVCEDNAYAATTRATAMTAGAGCVARAESFGMSAVQVDGNDIMAVEQAARQLVEAIRAGEGPRLLHALTYRHTGHTASDAGHYRDPQEVRAKVADDPITRSERLLAMRGIDAANLQSIVEEADAEMAQHVELAERTPYPARDQAFTDVQDIGSPIERAYSWPA